MRKNTGNQPATRFYGHDYQDALHELSHTSNRWEGRELTSFSAADECSPPTGLCRYKRTNKFSQKRTYLSPKEDILDPLWKRECTFFVKLSYSFRHFCHNKFFRIQNYWLIPEAIVTNIEITQIMNKSF